MTCASKGKRRRFLSLLFLFCVLCLPVHAARDFDGVDDKIDFGDVTVLDGLTTISAHCWENIDVVANTVAFAKSNSSIPTNGFALRMDTSDAGRSNLWQVRIDVVGSSVVVISGATNSASAAAGWQPVGFSWQNNSSTGLRLYIDGAEDPNSPVSTTTQTSSFPDNSDSLTAGSASSSFFFNGQLTECALWNVILTANEFASLGAGVSAARIRPTALAFYSPIWGVATPEADLSGNANNGTVTGAVLTDHCPCGPYRTGK